MSKCFGVLINLQDKNNPVSENTDIGLYNIYLGNSQFRWIQNDIDDLGWIWKSGIILKNGLSNFTVKIDLTNGGSTSLPGNGSISLNDLNNFWSTVENLGIKFNGLKLEIWELGSGSHWRKLRTYFCREHVRDSYSFTIPFIGGQELRVANILNVINEKQFPYASNNTIGKIIPATFGKLIPLIDENGLVIRSSFCKFIRSNDKINFFSDDYFTESGFIKTDSFPLEQIGVGGNVNWYTCSLRGSGPESEIVYFTDDIIQHGYIQIVDGTGKGQIRKIDVLYILDSTIVFHVVDYFETQLLNSDGESGRSWCQVVNIFRDYNCDHLSCEGFYNQNNEKLINGAEMYTFTDDDGIQRIAPYGYEFKNSGLSNNKISIDPKLFEEGNLDTQDSFLILPVVNIKLSDDADLSEWATTEESFWSNYIKHVSYDGYYSTGGGTFFPDVINDLIFNDMQNIIDGNSESYGNLYLDVTQNAGLSGYAKVCTFELPSIPKGFTFSKCLIGIKFNLSIVETGGSGEAFLDRLRIMLRKFKYGIKSINFITDTEHSDFEINVDDLPDFYFEDNPSTGNKNFFVEQNYAYTYSGSGFNTGDRVITGIGTEIFDTDITTIEEYNAYVKGCFIVDGGGIVGVDNFSWIDDTKVFELCFIFLRSSDIKSEIYSPMYGRTFSDDWEGRRTPTIVMNQPNDLLEHICRLQNYQDTSPSPVSGWGLQYADTPLIGTVDFGNFDDSDLIASRDFESACQIFEFDDGYTDKIKQSICNDFVIANWQDKDGYERVISLPESRLNPVYTIQLSDITDRNKIKINQISEEKIIAEPWVNFNKNPANDNYENTISVRNTSAGTYTSSFVSGVENENEAAALWAGCHSLSLRTHKINKPSINKTDLQFANGSGGYTIALRYIQNWINWQLNTEEIEFPVHFNLCASWGECTPINILLSYQTNNISRSALIEQIEINPNPDYEAMIKAIMYI